MSFSLVFVFESSVILLALHAEGDEHHDSFTSNYPQCLSTSRIATNLTSQWSTASFVSREHLSRKRTETIACSSSESCEITRYIDVCLSRQMCSTGLSLSRRCGTAVLYPWAESSSANAADEHCEEWSQSVRIVFSASKCSVPVSVLQLLGWTIPLRMRRQKWSNPFKDHRSKNDQYENGRWLRCVRCSLPLEKGLGFLFLVDSIYADVFIPFSYVTSTVYKKDVQISPQFPESIIRIEVGEASSLRCFFLLFFSPVRVIRQRQR